MVSTLETILPKLKEKYKEIPEKEIELIVDLYFETGKSLIETMEKPEVAFVWGTMRPNPKECHRARVILEKKLEENPEDLVSQRRQEVFKNFYFDYRDKLITGKTSRKYKNHKKK